MIATPRLLLPPSLLLALVVAAPADAAEAVFPRGEVVELVRGVQGRILVTSPAGAPAADALLAELARAIAVAGPRVTEHAGRVPAQAEDAAAVVRLCAEDRLAAVAIVRSSTAMALEQARAALYVCGEGLRGTIAVRGRPPVVAATPEPSPPARGRVVEGRTVGLSLLAVGGGVLGAAALWAAGRGTLEGLCPIGATGLSDFDRCGRRGYQGPRRMAVAGLATALLGAVVLVASF